MQKEETEKQTFECPNCGAQVEKFYLVGPNNIPWCAECGQFVKKDKIPEGAPLEKKESKEKSKETEKEGQEKPKEGTKQKTDQRAGKDIFRRPKPAEKVMEEVLRDYGIGEKETGEKLIRLLKNRSKRVDGITPRELEDALMNLKGGFRNRTQARYVADEYGYALEKEQQKAQRKGIRMSYPLPKTPSGTSQRMDRSYGRGDRSYNRRDRSYNRRDRQQPPPQNQYPGDRRNDRRFNQRLRETKRDIKEFKDRITDKLNEVVTAVNKDLQGNSKSDEVITKSDLEKLKLENQVELLEKEVENRKETQDQLIKEMRKDRKKFMDALERRGSSEGYKTDEFRFMGEGLHRLADVVEQKEPIKSLYKLEKMEKGEGERPPRRRETSESESSVDEMLEQSGGDEFIE